MAKKLTKKRPLQGVHIAITGASRGIGLAIARELASQGATLSLMSRDMKKLKTVSSELSKQFKILVSPILIDVTDSKSVKHAFRQAKLKHHEIDILVNNAGAAESAPFARTDGGLWNRMLSLNLTGAYLCSTEVVSPMVEKGWGKIINIASTAGLTGYAYMTAYCAAKHGLVGFTRALALELAKKGVSVNAICPGYTNTDLLRNAAEKVSKKTGRSIQAINQEYKTHNPQGKFVEPEEIAKLVGWIATNDSNAITGQTIVIDGGEVLK